MPVPLALVDKPIVDLLQLQPCFLHKPSLVLLLRMSAEMIISSGKKMQVKRVMTVSVSCHVQLGTAISHELATKLSE